jgi:hypothetical protein
MLMAAEVKPGSTFRVGGQRALFPVHVPGGFMPYDVSADGQRFLFASLGQQRRSPTLTILLDWAVSARH